MDEFLTDEDLFGQEEPATGSIDDEGPDGDFLPLNASPTAGETGGGGTLTDADIFGEPDDQVQGSQPSPGSAQTQSGSTLTDEQLFLTDEDLFGPDKEWSPLASGVAGAVKGAVPASAGMAAGLAVGAAATPFLTPIGGIAAGLAAGVGAGWLAGMGQDKFLEAIGLKQTFDEAERANPLSFFTGEIVPSAAFLRPSGAILDRALGAGIGGGAEAGMSLLEGRDMDWRRIGIAAGAGAALPRVNRLGQRFVDAGTSAGARLRGGTNPNPDVTPTADPPPGPDDIEWDIPTASPAGGVAQAHSPAQEVPSAGTPEGAPMAAREAARPSSPERDYRKDVPTVPSDTSGQPSTTVDTAEVPADIAAAVTREPPRPPIQTGIVNEQVQLNRLKAFQKATDLGVLDDVQDMIRKGYPSEQIASAVDWKLEQPEVRAIRSLMDSQGQTTPAPAQNRPDDVAPPAQNRPDDVAPPIQSQPTAAPAPAGKRKRRTKAEMQAAREAEQAAVRAELDAGSAALRRATGRTVEDPTIPRSEADYADAAVGQTAEDDFAAVGRQFAENRATETDLRAALDRDYPNATMGQIDDAVRAFHGGEQPDTVAITPASPEPPTVSAETGLGDIGEALLKVKDVREEMARQARGNPAWERVIQQFDALPIEEQIARTENVNKMLAQGKRRETRPVVEGGFAQARATKDAARKNAAIATWVDAYNEYGPNSENGKKLAALMGDKNQRAAARQVATTIWDDIVKRNSGVDPISRTSYMPSTKDHPYTEQIQWLRGLKAFVKKYEAGRFASLHVPRAEGTEGVGKIDAAAGRTEGDIRHRPSVPEAAADTMTAAPERPLRQEFEMLPEPETGDKSFVQAQNTIRALVNDLTTEQHERIRAADIDLGLELNSKGDPQELLSAIMQALADTGARPQRVITHPPEGERGRPVRIDTEKLAEIKQRATPTDRFDPDTSQNRTVRVKEGDVFVERRVEGVKAASEGRKLDRNSEEFKRLAAQYTQDTPKGGLLSRLAKDEEGGIVVGHEEDVPRSNVHRLTLKEREQLAAKARGEPVDGTNTPAAESKLKKFFSDFKSDEEGAISLPVWMRRAPRDTPEFAMGDEITENLREVTRDIQNNKAELRANMVAAPALDRQKWANIYNAEETNSLHTLTQEERAAYHDYVKPIAERGKALLREIDTYAKALGLKQFDIPPLTHGIANDYVPRHAKGKQLWDREDADIFDPVVGKSLSLNAPSLERREWFTMQNTAGDRLVLQLTPTTGGDVTATVWRNGAPTRIKGVPPGFKGEINDTLKLKVGGNSDTWTVDHASVKEIHTATDGRVQYHENPLYSWSKTVDDLYKVKRNLEVMDKLMKDKRLLDDFSTTDHDVAVEKGFDPNPTRLPEFSHRGNLQVYYAKPVKWALDDFHQTGFGVGVEGLEAIRNFNTTLLKIFNTNAPLVHVMNEADLFFTDRGLRWLSPTGYKNLFKFTPVAVKSVWAQDDLQRELRRAGGNPLLESVYQRPMYEVAAKKMQMDIKQNPSDWDPIAKAFGITTKQLGDKMYDWSSDVTWRLSDVMTTIRYLESKAEGMTNRQAAERAHKFMSDYQMDTTVLGSRKLQQFLTERSVTAFGRYKAGVFRSLGHMVNNFIHGDKTAKDITVAGRTLPRAISTRTEAAGQMVAQLVLLSMLYPAATAAVQAISSNEDAEVRHRGASAILGGAGRMLAGEKGPPLSHVWTSAPATSLALQAASNKDFAGQEIWPQGEWPGVIPDAITNVAEYAAGSVVPPYGIFSKHYARPDGGVAGGAEALLFDQIGVSLPSEGAIKRKERIDRVNAQAAKRREQRPSGVIPDIGQGVKDWMLP